MVKTKKTEGQVGITVFKGSIHTAQYLVPNVARVFGFVNAVLNA